MYTAESSVPILDDRVLAELQTLGTDVLAEIFDLFLVDVPARVTKLHDAVNARSCEAVVREAHALKGSSLGIGASRLAMLCAAIEHHARKGNIEQATARSSSLDGAFAQVRDAIKAVRARRSTHG
jgi:HPt (histidine-containing phosphotransfer) domain-containing protein